MVAVTATVGRAPDAVGALVRAALALVPDGGRALLGLTGPPGAGKSTLAAQIVAAAGEGAVVVGMDGFHLAQAELVRLGRAGRKGAPDTFDVAGYVHLLRRLRDRSEAVVYAPRFDRDLEEPIAGAVPVADSVSLVVTEGNYLLLDAPGWDRVAGLLDACWYVDPGEDDRVRRLVARHVAHGRDPAAARAWALGTDQRNAELVAVTRPRADRVVHPG